MVPVAGRGIRLRRGQSARDGWHEWRRSDVGRERVIKEREDAETSQSEPERGCMGAP